MTPLPSAAALLAVVLGVSPARPDVVAPAPATQSGIRVPAVETVTMPLSEVRVGMTGYGKSVFAGTAIETFPVVVRSVVSDSSAGRGTVWIECTDERMQRSGPVQGMSGSPIYLWDQDAAQKVDGEGGRLIGAFAFGYSDVNVCLVGVQPIGYMREVGGHAVAAQDRAQEMARRVGPRALATTLSGLAAAAELAGGQPGETRPLRALARVLAPGVARGGVAAAGDAPRPLGLPVTVGSAEAARWLTPVLAPAGLAVRSGGGGATPYRAPAPIAGAPPSNVDAGQVQLEPGSVLSIPLAWGDLDLNASGTVTEVRPDGTVLAFGHAMNAVGDTRLPMATGYTHFVVSRTSISFKQASSLQLVGTILRDEQSAVAGRPLDADEMAGAFGAAPVSVHVEQPHQPPRDYHFHVVDDPVMTSGILAAVVINAVNAVQDFPLEHTLRLTGELRFTGDRVLPLDVTLPGSGARGLAFSLLPYVGAMMQNGFDPLKLESADLSVVVDDRVEMLTLDAASLDRSVARPGDQVRVDVELASYRGDPVQRTVMLDLPADLPAGEYDLMVTDASDYTDRMLVSRPDLLEVEDIDGLFDFLKAIASVDDSAVYLGLTRPELGVALAGRPLPSLPGSRAAVMGAAATTRVAPYPRFIEVQANLDHAVVGSLLVPLVVEAAR